MRHRCSTEIFSLFLQVHYQPGTIQIQFPSFRLYSKYLAKPYLLIKDCILSNKMSFITLKANAKLERIQNSTRSAIKSNHVRAEQIEETQRNERERERTNCLLVGCLHCSYKDYYLKLVLRVN